MESGFASRGIPAPRGKLLAPVLFLLPVAAIVGLLIHAHSIVVKPEFSIHDAIWKRDLDAVKAHLQTGTSINELNEVGQTPLYTAISSKRRPEFVEYLLHRGANPNAEANGRQTPLFAAARNGDLTLVRRLLRLKARVDAQTAGGQTALHAAVSGRNTEVVKALLDAGANPRQAANDGTTPLHAACERDQLETAQALIDRGVAVNSRGAEGRTPLLIAISRGNSAIVQLLLAKGANVKIPQRDGLTCLHLAMVQGDLVLGNELVKRGADVNARGPRGRTPLHAAAGWNRYECVQMLLEHGADPNLRGGNNMPPLAAALMNARDERISTLLLKRTSNLDIKGRDGSSLALFAVAGNRSSDLVLSLLEHGSDPFVTNTQGLSAIKLAKERKRTDLVSLFESTSWKRAR